MHTAHCVDAGPGRWVCGLIAFALLAGCSVLPEPRQHGVSLPEQFSRGVHAPATLESGTWWERFNDPQLEALIISGLEHSPSIQAARARLRAAEHDARAAGLGFEGDATASASGSSGAPGSRSVGLGLDLLPFGRRTADLALAEARLDEERQSFLDTRRLLVSNLASEYIQLRYFEALLNLRREELELARGSLDAAVSQADLNVGTELDVLDARAFLAEVQTDIPAIEASIVTTQRRIAILLGMSPDATTSRLPHGGAQPIPTGMSDIGVPADLVRRRPDVRQAEQTYAAALAELGIARANRLPRLSLSGIVRAALPGDTARTGTIGISIPVFEQPAMASAEDAAGARAQQAYLSWQNAVVSAVHEVERSLAELILASERLSAAQRAVRLQERRAALVREAQADSSAFTIEDVIEADRALTQSKQRTIESAQVLATAYVSLWTALGATSSEDDLHPQNMN